MIKKLTPPVCLGLLLALSGCAGYSIKNEQGQHYAAYLPIPHLLVTPAKDNALTAQIVYLPDYSDRYEIRTWNFLGKADFSFTLEDGWRLTSISDKSDNSGVANTLAGDLKTILGALGNSAGTATTKATDRGSMKPGLYRIDMGKLIPVEIGTASSKSF